MSQLARCGALMLYAMCDMIAARRVAVRSHIGSGSVSSLAQREDPFPPLCDQRIVAATCANLNRQTLDVYKTSADVDSTVVHVVELAEHFMVSTRAIQTFLMYLGMHQNVTHLANEEHNKAALDSGAFAIKCSDLCALTVASIPDNHRPQHSDQGCYIPADSAKAECDIDLSDAAFSNMAFSNHTEEEATNRFGELVDGLRRHKDNFSEALHAKSMDVLQWLDLEQITNTSEETNQLFKAHGDLDWLDLAQLNYHPDTRHTANSSKPMPVQPQEYPYATVAELTITVSNMFRIYPPVQIAVVDSRDDSTSQESGKLSERNHHGREANSCHQAVEGSDFRTHNYLHWNVKCKCESTECIFGDTPSCTEAVQSSVEVCRKFDPDILSKPQWKHCNLKCRDEMWKPQTPATLGSQGPGASGQSLSFEKASPRPTNTQCVDKPGTGFTSPSTGKPMSCFDLHSHCTKNAAARDACPKTCGLTCAEPPKPKPNTWQADVAKVGVKAQANTARALRKMGAERVPRKVALWFGDNSESTRKEIRRVLNGVNRMLMNVEYVYPGEKCKAKTYAYVYPISPLNMNRRGQYIFHLCDLYMKSDLAAQIETLTHEGSHHELMYTNDVCYEGIGDTCKKAYGRWPCRKLAKKSTSKALKNADSYCYFINDAAKSEA